MADLGKWCSEKTEAGQELECLQDHMEDLVSDCRDVVGNLTELESEDIQIEALLMRACEPVIQAYCHEVADNQIDSGDLMECLVQNKHQKEMNEKCAVGVTHFQLIQIKDFRFSYKFKTACKEDVLKLCPNIKKKVDVVICLSTTVRNDTLHDAKEQRVSVKCRKQLRVEEVEMVVECLKENKRQLTQRCHQRIFKLQEVEMVDPELDYQLMKVCKHMIRVGHKASTTSKDYSMLNPVLRKACKADIPKFCQSVLNKATADTELEGQVISCLKLKYADQEVLNMLKESKADIFVDPVLHTACALDIKHHCAAIPPGRGRQMSCLMEALQDKRVRLQPECKKRLQDRIDMWSYAAKVCPQLVCAVREALVAPAEGFSDLAMQVLASPSKNYIITVIGAGVALLFLVGMFCGRFTKRVTQELKDR
ncbi:glycogenin glucosyltransferase glg1 [Goodea atripinnis]|uniref:Golgi apparatus protein 1 n=1 Tax=Goodea atripinnis TaxID=208336 RepID=A0ABV0PVZ9_9TELE